jgi:hypothetical protein
MAAAFLSMGTANADDSDTPPDPFVDLLGANPSATDLANAEMLDSALVTAHVPGLLKALDTIADSPVTGTPIEPTGDNDPFQDLLGPNATADQLAHAEALDQYLFSTNPALSATLDAQLDSGTIPPPPDADPFADLFPSLVTGGDPIDNFLNSIGLAVPLDAWVDQLLTTFPTL